MRELRESCPLPYLHSMGIEFKLLTNAPGFASGHPARQCHPAPCPGNETPTTCDRPVGASMAINILISYSNIPLLQIPSIFYLLVLLVLGTLSSLYIYIYIYQEACSGAVSSVADINSRSEADIMSFRTRAPLFWSQVF